MRKIAVIAVISVTTAGCVTNGAVMLRNTQGSTITCQGNWGFGIVGAPVAMAQHSNCIKKAHEAGYYEIGQPIPPAPQKADPAPK